MADIAHSSHQHDTKLFATLPFAAFPQVRTANGTRVRGRLCLSANGIFGQESTRVIRRNTYSRVGENHYKTRNTGGRASCGANSAGGPQREFWSQKDVGGFGGM